MSDETRSFLDQKLRDELVDESVRVCAEAWDDDETEHVLRHGCVGLENMSDFDLVIDWLTLLANEAEAREDDSFSCALLDALPDDLLEQARKTLKWDGEEE